MRKRLYLLQWRDCQNSHNYRLKNVVSLISVRTPLQFRFDGYFVTYHTGYQLIAEVMGSNPVRA